MKNKISLLTIIVILFTIIIPGYTFAGEEIKVKINDELITFDTALNTENGRILVPVDFFEKLGAEINWDTDANKVFIDDKYTTIELVINKKTAYVNRKYDFSGIPEEVELDSTPKIINDTIVVPLRFVAESLGLKVDWDNKSRTAIVHSVGDIIPVETPASYTVENPENIRDDNELHNWYEKNRKIEGIYFKVTDSGTYVLVSAGEKPTGGYSIKIESATMVSPGCLYITAKVISPSPDMIVTQALTYPSVLLKFETKEIEKVLGDIPA